MYIFRDKQQQLSVGDLQVLISAPQGARCARARARARDSARYKESDGAFTGLAFGFILYQLSNLEGQVKMRSTSVCISEF